jgi:hypothetical protein
VLAELVGHRGGSGQSADYSTSSSSRQAFN